MGRAFRRPRQDAPPLSIPADRTVCLVRGDCPRDIDYPAKDVVVYYMPYLRLGNQAYQCATSHNPNSYFLRRVFRSPCFWPEIVYCGHCSLKRYVYTSSVDLQYLIVSLQIFVRSSMNSCGLQVSKTSFCIGPEFLHIRPWPEPLYYRPRRFN